MNRNRFEQLVAQAVEDLPEEFQERLENIDIVVEDYPTSDQLKSSGTGDDYTLLGLYEGVPLTERYANYGLVAPDKITIFHRTIEDKCGSANDDRIRKEVQKVVRHEVAHHFGIGDARLQEIEGDQD